LYESFRFFRSMANRDHKGDSIIDDIKQQAEAYPLYPFFNVDYNLRDRLLYALEGVDWVGKDEDEEVIFVIFLTRHILSHPQRPPINFVLDNIL